LARTLLLMAEYGEPGKPEEKIPPVTQGTLAEMIGTTRSRVSFFMNRFRKLGYIDYNGGIRVHKSLLNAALHGRLPEENTSRPELLDPQPVQHEPPNGGSWCERRIAIRLGNAWALGVLWLGAPFTGGSTAKRLGATKDKYGDSGLRPE